jgi:hypothetical protein
MTPANTTRQIGGSETQKPPEGIARIELEIQNGRVVSTRALWFFLITFLSGLISVQAGQMNALSGHVPPASALLQPLDSLAGSNRLHLAIGLPMRNQTALNDLLRDLYDPASPAYHHFLDSAQFTAAFGPTEKDYQTVINFAKTNGLTILSTFSNRALVEVSGRVSDIENTFHVHMRRFQHPSEPRIFYAPDVEPSVDSSIPVQFIGGLANYQLPHPSSFHAMPLAKSNGLRSNGGTGTGSAGGYYAGQDIRSAYAPGVTNTGAGQSVGLVEFDYYYPVDISDYLGLPQIGLTSSVTLSNVYVGPTNSPGTGNGEVALDIEMSICMAPGLSTIYVYEAINDAASPDLVLNQIAADDLSRQISCSWSGFDDATIENDFVRFAAQGQTFFIASGDSGAYFSTGRHSNPVSPPCDNTNVTAVGGTTLYTTGPQGSWTSETTWNWFSQPLLTLSNAATSGGISPTWSLPAWQQGIGTTTNKASSTFRNIPDVALLANDIFLYADDGTQEIAGGTSAAAPLWAGLTALMNQQLTNQAQPALGFLNPRLYSLAKSASYQSCFHDITVGNNTNLHSGGLYYSKPGYDLCTGWGSPNGSNLISTLCPEPLLVSPSTGFTASGGYGGTYSPSNQILVLTNVAALPFSWALGVSAPWLSASSTGGTLDSKGAAAMVMISLNSAATALGPGAYTNTVWLTNLNDQVVQVRQYTLVISNITVTPIVTWTNPSAIVYGTALGSAQLNATATVPGTFTYLPPGGSVLTVGTQPLEVIFNPNDPVDYGSVTSGVSLVVARAPLTVTAASAARPFGQANPVFSGSISGLQNGDNISALYNCSAINSSMVGTYPIVPSLVDPADLETNYTVDLITGLLSVQPTTPTLNWINPASITYGTPLGSAQLNATANTPGSYVYFPAAGSALFPGAQPLTAIFSPADAVDYTTATTGVSLVVSPAPLTLTATPVSLTYGDTIPPLSGTVTGFVGSDNQADATTGSLSFTTPATATSPVGNYAITGSGLTATNYIFVQATGNTNALTINPATPLVAWTNPAPIIYGTALSGSQLDATANVAGSFNYTPAAGAVPGVGLQVLSADFTPFDTTNYIPVLGTTVSLIVDQAPPPMATNIVISNGTGTISFIGVAGVTYVTESAVNLAGPWTPISTNTPGADASWQVTDSNATGSQKFYQAVIP